MKTSLIQGDIKQCYVTGAFYGDFGEPLEKHHIMNGPLRSWADDEGLFIWVTPQIHRWLHTTGTGVNVQRHVLKAIAQLYFERAHSRDEWMRVVHKNYV